MSSTLPSANATSSRTIFARRLRELRVPRGYRTARSLAQALGIDENRYTRYERAEVEPDLGLLMKICEVLALTPNELLMDAPVAGPMIGMPRATGAHAAMPPGQYRDALAAAPAHQPAGFAEAAPAQTIAEFAPATDPLASSATLKRRALAWQLARFVGVHGIDMGLGGTATSRGELGGVQRTSRVFATIERDPFAFVTALAAAPKVGELADADQRRLATLIDDLVGAVDAITQGGRPTS